MKKTRASAALSRCARVCAVAFLAIGAVDTREPQSSPEITATTQAINDFTLALLKLHVANENASANEILSAQGVFHGLAISYIASGGATRAELASVFGFPDDDERLMADLAALRKQLEAAANPPRIEVSMDNALWLDSTHARFREDYVKKARYSFDAHLAPATFADGEGASAEINEWASEKTRGRIQQVVGPADFASRSRPGVIDEPGLVSVNAVFFKADWDSRFDKASTQPRPFHIDAATKVDATMMHQRSILPYAENDQFKMLKLPYVGDTFSMYLFLPNPGGPGMLPGIAGAQPAPHRSVQDLLRGMSPETIAELKRNLRPEEVDVLLPKFEMRSHLDVKDSLSAMGVLAAFDARKANFDRMVAKTTEAYRVYIDAIYQDAWIDVHEEGTEAAAVTTTIYFSIGCSAAPHVMPAYFHADRPFAFLIVHNQSQSILFGGWVSDPRDFVN